VKWFLTAVSRGSPRIRQLLPNPRTGRMLRCIEAEDFITVNWTPAARLTSELSHDGGNCCCAR